MARDDTEGDWIPEVLASPHWHLTSEITAMPDTIAVSGIARCMMMLSA